MCTIRVYVAIDFEPWELYDARENEPNLAKLVMSTRCSAIMDEYRSNGINIFEQEEGGFVVWYYKNEGTPDYGFDQLLSDFSCLNVSPGLVGARCTLATGRLNK